MAELLEVLIYFVVELFGYTAIEVLLEWLFNRIPSAIWRALTGAEDVRPAVQALGWLLIGLVAGALTLLVYPEPLFRRGRLSGLSLLLSPLLTGAVMELLGRRRAAIGKGRLPLSNFRNGAAFAFGFALARFFFTAAS